MIVGNNMIFLKKGTYRINVDSLLAKKDKKYDYNKLGLFIENCILSKLALNDGSILALRDIRYKTYLSEKLINTKSNNINNNPHVKLNYLLGSSIFFLKKKAG